MKTIPPITEAEIMAARTPAGGWTREQLAQWGVPWPPPKGWKKALMAAGRCDDVADDLAETMPLVVDPNGERP